MRTAEELFGVERALVGMVHLGALPGTPRAEAGVDQIVSRAVAEARLLVDNGFDALLLENMHDLPYLMRTVGPEIVASMTASAIAVRSAVDVPIGIQVLAGANREALAVAQAAGCGFIRAEGFVFASVADEGLLETADAGPLLRYRRSIGADDIAVLADVKKKHSAHAITADVDLAETVHAAEFCGADGVIITGTATGKPVARDDLARCRAATDLPVVVGSGASPETLGQLLQTADAVIVGSWYKRDGRWANAPDPARVATLVAAKP
jgi:hypothetical protein